MAICITTGVTISWYLTNSHESLPHHVGAISVREIDRIEQNLNSRTRDSYNAIGQRIHDVHEEVRTLKTMIINHLIEHDQKYQSAKEKS